MLKNIKYLFFVVLFLFLAKPAFAQEATLHFFWSYGCPHCAKEKAFLETLKGKYPKLKVNEYEVSSSPQNLEILQKTGERLQADTSGVPFTVIGEEYIIGYLNDQITGKEIEEKVECAINNGCSDLVSNLTPEEKVNKEVKEEVKAEKEASKILSIPVFGEVDLKSFSLPLLTVVLALLDGFNPCAMWTLLFLISLLLGMKNKRRMWALGIAFIASSALVYFLFLAAWLNLFLFLGFIIWVRLLIGLVALGAGGYYLRDYIVNKQGRCAVMGNQNRQKVFEKIRNITQKRSFALAIIGIILLAFAVNLVELICSAGLPAIYTNILSLSNLPTFQYYLYLLLYIFIFMLDDLFIFFMAMTTLQIVGIQSKYSRFSHLIGGILMLIIGFLLLFKPEWLMFG